MHVRQSLDAGQWKVVGSTAKPSPDATFWHGGVENARWYAMPLVHVSPAMRIHLAVALIAEHSQPMSRIAKRAVAPARFAGGRGRGDARVDRLNDLGWYVVWKLDTEIELGEPRLAVPDPASCNIYDEAEDLAHVLVPARRTGRECVRE